MNDYNKKKMKTVYNVADKNRTYLTLEVSHL